MHFTTSATIALCCLVAQSPALAQSPATLSLVDPVAFVKQLDDMGFAPSPLEGVDPPTTTITAHGSTYGVALGGCKTGRNCRYAVLFGIFDDVLNPPAEWLAKMNAEYDYLKIWTNDAGKLTYSVGIVADGMNRATFRSAIDLFAESESALAQDALKDGLGPKPAQ